MKKTLLYNIRERVKQTVIP